MFAYELKQGHRNVEKDHIVDFQCSLEEGALRDVGEPMAGAKELEDA